MKFRWIDKFLLVLLLLFTIGLSALLIGTAMTLVTQDMLVNGVEIMTNGMIENQLILGAIGLVLLVIALRLFIAMGKRKATKEPVKQPTSTLLLAGDNGTAYIALSAVDALVQRHCRANQKIRECESAVNAATAPGGGVNISLKLSVLPDTVIPELTASLQQSLKAYIENVCGIAVVSVDILVIPMQQPKAPKTL